MELLFLVIKSWQVIVVTIVIVLFIYFVNYVSSSYRPRFVSKAKPKKMKVQKQVKTVKKASPDIEI